LLPKFGKTGRDHGALFARFHRPVRGRLELAPDWACEIMGPSTRKYDLTDKREIYAEVGAAHLWKIDPLERTLEAFALREGRRQLLGAVRDEDPVRLPHFDAIEFPLSALWPD
jgi:Uma2 family endonuclease